MNKNEYINILKFVRRRLGLEPTAEPYSSGERCRIMAIFHHDYPYTVFFISCTLCDIFVAGYIKSHIKF